MSVSSIISIVVFIMISSSTVFAKTIFLVTLESPPAEYSENGKPTGRNVEIVEEGLKRMGYDCKISFLPWKRALLMVEEERADGIVDVAYSEERAKYLYYPHEEIYIEEWYAFKRKESNLMLDQDLGNAGKITLGISRGFVYGGIIQEAINNHRFKRIEEVHNNELNIKKLVAKRFDMFIGVKLTILFLAEKMGYIDQIDIVNMTNTDQNYLLSASKTYVGFSKKSMKKEDAEEFSSIITAMKKDGTVKKIEEKYYSKEIRHVGD